MKVKVVIVLLLGITIGVIVALFEPEKVLAKRIISAVLLEDQTESDATESGITEEGVSILKDAATSTSLIFDVPNEYANATSSPLSIKVPVIIYHSVRPYIKGESKYQDLYDVTPELLEQELTFIEKNDYHTIDMRDVDAYWSGATSSLPDKPVILTFDDGWRNQYKYAFPLLTKHHMKGVFYIFTNPIDHKKPHWMSWADVIALDHAGMEVAGHSRTHPVLAKITADTKLDYEILESKQIIESHLGHPIISFAYPFGAKNKQVERAVERAGYHVARTTYSGVWNDPDHRYQFHGTLSSDKLSQFESLLEKK